MNVLEICQRHVVTVRRHDELLAAARMMRERNVGCLVVVEAAGGGGGERPIGMLTDRDIVRSAIAGACELRGMVVDEVMTRHPVTVWSSSTIDDALQRMRDAHVRRVPVIDDRGRLAGILVLDDIFEHLSQCVPFAATPIRRETRIDLAAHP